MGKPSRLAGLALVHVLLLVTTAELAFNRLATRELRPLGDESPPWWHLALDHVGLFLQYFASTLALGIVARKLWRLRRRPLYWAGARWGLVVAGAAFLGLATLNIASSPDVSRSFLFDLSFVAVVVLLVLGQLTRRGDTASKVGLLLLAVPLTIPVLGPVILRLLGDTEVLWGDVPERIRLLGQLSMVATALLSPYCFAPRPLASSAARLGPLVIAGFVGVIGVIIVRQHYEIGMRLAYHGLGIDIGPGAPAQLLTPYLVALATVTWTLASCLSADVAARRDIGVGLGLVVLGGYGFAWPLQYLVSAAGLLTIGEAATRVREEERAQAASQGGFHVPPIAASVWERYARALADALRKGADAEVSMVTVRNQDDADTQEEPDEGEESATTHVRTRRRGVEVSVRIERERGALVCMDIFCGDEPPGDAAPQWTLYALPEKLLGIGAHPEPPATRAPVVRVDDASFAQRFRVHDAGGITERLLDAGLRARVTALIDGWLAFWENRGLRYRVLPGRGAPLDHPVPITELAFRGAAASPSAERVVTLIDVLVDIARQGLAAPAQPAAAGDRDSEHSGDASISDGASGSGDASISDGASGSTSSEGPEEP